MAPYRALPVVFKVGEVVGRLDERVSSPRGGYRQLNIVLRLQKLDLLSHSDRRLEVEAPGPAAETSKSFPGDNGSLPS